MYHVLAIHHKRNILIREATGTLEVNNIETYHLFLKGSMTALNFVNVDSETLNIHVVTQSILYTRVVIH